MRMPEAASLSFLAANFFFWSWELSCYRCNQPPNAASKLRCAVLCLCCAVRVRDHAPRAVNCVHVLVTSYLKLVIINCQMNDSIPLNSIPPHPSRLGRQTTRPAKDDISLGHPPSQ
ncbi:hypothetical protein GGI35DRAFT_187593 [Trichoderma velutinum]